MTTLIIQHAILFIRARLQHCGAPHGHDRLRTSLRRRTRGPVRHVTPHWPLQARRSRSLDHGRSRDRSGHAGDTQLRPPGPRGETQAAVERSIANATHCPTATSPRLGTGRKPRASRQRFSTPPRSAMLTSLRTYTRTWRCLTTTRCSPPPPAGDSYTAVLRLAAELRMARHRAPPSPCRGFATPRLAIVRHHPS